MVGRQVASRARIFFKRSCTWAWRR